jgi:hypothetical protein
MAMEWRSPTGRRHTDEEIAAFEAAMGITLPAALKAGHAVGMDARVWKDGRLCDATRVGDGVEATLFHGLTYLRSRGDVEYYREEYQQRWGKDLSQMIPFGDNGDLFVCLDYRKGPTDPEVWSLDMDMPMPDSGYYKVADTFDRFLDALAPSEDIDTP